MSLISLSYVDVFDKNREKKLEFSKDLLDENSSLNSLFVLRVDGESMQPVILHKALVVADLSQKEFIEDNIYVVSVAGKIWIKKAKFIDKEKKFVSINKKFSHQVFAFEETRVIARVLLTFRKL